MSNLGYVYETTNKINGKKYIGSHIGSANDLYWGNGSDFQKDFVAYGEENFSRVILEFASSIELLKEAEEKWLNSVDAKNNIGYYNRSNHSSGVRKKDIERSICPVCRDRLIAVNCIKNGTTYYRKMCDQCLRKGRKLRPQVPGWARSGYTKKEKCERCNFKFKLLGQSRVFYIDGNLNNNDWINLKTVCLNCQEEVSKSKLPWRPSPLVPDF